MKKLFYFLYKSLTDLIAPPFCANCRSFLKKRDVLCDICTGLIKPIVSKQIDLCGNYSMKVYAVAKYEDPLKSLILAKSNSNRVASIQMAELIWKHSGISNLEFDYIVPVPLHWTRLAWRGYNQSLVMAQHLSKLSGKPVANLLRRNRRTLFQSAVSAKERQKNVADAFTIIGEKDTYQNKVFLLVDDLMTTGATLREAGKHLVKLEPKNILATVLSRVD